MHLYARVDSQGILVPSLAILEIQRYQSLARTLHFGITSRALEEYLGKRAQRYPPLHSFFSLSLGKFGKMPKLQFSDVLEAFPTLSKIKF